MFVPENFYHLFSVRFPASERMGDEYFWLYYYPSAEPSIIKCRQLLDKMGYKMENGIDMIDMKPKTYTIYNMNEKDERWCILVRMKIAIRYDGGRDVIVNRRNQQIKQGTQ